MREWMREWIASTGGKGGKAETSSSAGKRLARPVRGLRYLYSYNATRSIVGEKVVRIP